MSLTKLKDNELISLYLKGCERSFEVLTTRHHNKIYTSIYLFVKDHSQAADIYQDVLIKIVNTLRKGKYNHEGKFVQWATRISYNMCVDHFRKKKRRAIISPSDDFDVFEIIKTSERSIEDILIRNQAHSKLRTLIDQLPAEQKEVVMLRHFADLSFKEISKLTHVSINTALGRMRYALINLRKLAESQPAFAY